MLLFTDNQHSRLKAYAVTLLVVVLNAAALRITKRSNQVGEKSDRRYFSEIDVNDLDVVPSRFSFLRGIASTLILLFTDAHRKVILIAENVKLLPFLDIFLLNIYSLRHRLE